MKRSILLIPAAAALALVPATTAWAQNPWLHVRVEEPSKETKVHVNLPLTVVEAALSAAPERIISEGKIHIRDGKHDLSIADMRKVWLQLKEAGNAEIVKVEGKKENVSVAREGDVIRVRVDKLGETEAEAEGEQVRVEVPVAVVDALFSAEGEDLNIRAALAELQKLRGDIVRVKDKDSTVRVWIDEVK
jgi:hypothetical protein